MGLPLPILKVAMADADIGDDPLMNLPINPERSRRNTATARACKKAIANSQKEKSNKAGIEIVFCDMHVQCNWQYDMINHWTTITHKISANQFTHRIRFVGICVLAKVPFRFTPGKGGSTSTGDIFSVGCWALSWIRRTWTRHAWSYFENDKFSANKPHQLCAQAELQTQAAFLPGYIAAGHIENVAKHLVSAVALVEQRAGACTSDSAHLTGLLGVAELN